mgnify:CR=1 FL=1|jgi:hypothetical protein
MINPLKGEHELELAGKTYKTRLTIDALVKIETALNKGVIEIVTELTNARVRIFWLMTILTHALRGGGNDIQDQDVKDILMKEGIANATIKVATLLANSLNEGSDETVKKNPEE